MNTLPGIPFRPLGLILNVIEGCGFTLGHVYEDLVFTEENVVLLRMEDQSEIVSYYINEDCEEKAAADMESTLSFGALDQGLEFINRGHYTLEQSKDKAFEVRFIDT